TSDTTLPAILAANESFLYTVHDAGLPWWATIIASTLLLRSTMTLPIAIYQQRSLGKMINLAPIIQSWAETFKTQLAKESSAKGWNYQRYQSELQKQYRKKVNSIYAHYGCSRWKIVVLPWIQIPLFVSMSLTLRHITAFPLPWFGKTTNVPADGMLDGGLAWFVDLTATDSTMILPILIGAGNLINVEV
ncbi:membrane insertase OXA1/ALB3/YidC, partial [Cokeromyces recurvatus]|uniref:membrane insertase OXA1/ALB3/YidC n=1 Tax=Cokeromyces recurvatus TaxID=90255 RepID=UPI00221EAFC6